MKILNVTSTIGLIGLILLIVGLLNKSKSWSKRIITIGTALMAVHIITDAGLGFYDGITGNPHR